MTETGKSNYPVRTPMGAQLTEEVVREIAKLLEARGFPPFTDEDIGRLHLLLYDLLYEGHEDTMRLQWRSVCDLFRVRKTSPEGALGTEHFPKQMAGPECPGETARARDCPVEHAPGMPQGPFPNGGNVIFGAHTRRGHADAGGPGGGGDDRQVRANERRHPAVAPPR
jgi:hypothetical protein